MLFNSLGFAVFLPIVFLIYWALPHKYRVGVLLIASYYFYMSWNVKYVVLILFTTVISYICALYLEKTDDDKRKKLYVLTAVVASLAVLFTFKYFNFTVTTIQRIADKIKIPLHTTTLSLMLPVGISFYTFQTLSYVIDVYRKRVNAEHNFFTYAAFISFFPQLVAGPIERSENLLPQIKGEHRFTYEEGSYGIKLMAWGFFKKLVIADNLALFVDMVFDDPESYTGFPMVLAVLFFTIQIYCDFSGYSDIAIGTARLFDIKLMKNFDSPYFATSIQDFWRRWHISLSTWFRDYVYIPLGGNRVKKGRQYFNLMATFTLSGLWHGAAFSYIAWGMMHGLVQCIEKAVGVTVGTVPACHTSRDKRGLSPLSRLRVFITAAALWCFFRATSLKQALYVFKHMPDGITGGLNYFTGGIKVFDTNLLCWMIIPVLMLYLYDRASLKVDIMRELCKLKPIARWFIYVVFMIIFLLLASFNSQEFVYFQF